MSKMVVMSFWDNKNDLDIKIDGQTIPLVQTTKYLRVTLDNNLTWDEHVNLLCNKLQANKHMLSMSAKLLTTSNLKLLYYAYIYSHLMYRLGAWGNMANNAQIKNLQVLQKACIRLVAKKKKNNHIKGLFMDLKIVEISDLVKIKSAKMGHKISTRQFPTLLLEIFNANGG